MVKIEKLIPEKLHAIGHNVVVSEKTFELIIKTINIQTSTINKLIDCVSEESAQINNVNKDVSDLKTATQTLAVSLKLLTEE